MQAAVINILINLKSQQRGTCDSVESEFPLAAPWQWKQIGARTFLNTPFMLLHSLRKAFEQAELVSRRTYQPHTLGFFIPTANLLICGDESFDRIPALAGKCAITSFSLMVGLSPLLFPLHVKTLSCTCLK